MNGLLSETVNHKLSAEGITLWVLTLGKPDPAKMTPQREKKTPKNVDPGHTA